MQDLKDVWGRMQGTKQQQKTIRLLYKDSLESNREYRDLVEQLKQLKAKKSQIETETKSEMGKQYEELSRLAKELSLDKEMLADIAISSLMKGDPVKLTDEHDVEYEPVFSVRFRKLNEVSQRPG